MSLQLRDHDKEHYVITGQVGDWTDELIMLKGVRHSNSWMFDKSKVDYLDLENFVYLANNKKILPSRDSGSAGYNLRRILSRERPLEKSKEPIKYAPIKYQTMSYVLPMPKIGEKVIVTYQGVNYEYEIVDRKFNGTFVTNFDIRYGNDFAPIKVFIKNGKWTLDMPNVGPHSFYFL